MLPFDPACHTEQFSFRLSALYHIVEECQICLADRALLRFRQKNAMQGLSQVLLRGSVLFELWRAISLRSTAERCALVLVDQIDAPRPGDQIIGSVQEIGTPALTAAVDRVGEVEGWVAAK